MKRQSNSRARTAIFGVSQVLAWLCLLLPASLLAPIQKTKCLLEIQLLQTEQTTERTRRELKRLQTELSHLQGDETEAIQQARLETEEKIKGVEEQVKQQEKMLQQLQEKRQLFTDSKSGKRWDYFCASSLMTATYESEAENLIPVLDRLVQPTSLSGKERLQIFIYDKAESFERHERQFTAPVGALNGQDCKCGFFGSWTAPNGDVQSMIALKDPQSPNQPTGQVPRIPGVLRLALEGGRETRLFQARGNRTSATPARPAATRGE